MNNKTVALSVLVSAGLAMSVGACGGGGSSKAPASAASSATPSAELTPNGIEQLSAQDILAKAFQTLKDGQSAHAVGQAGSNGQVTSLDISMDTAANCVGTMGLTNQGTFKLVKVGKQIWFKPDQTFWAAHGGPATAQLVGDKYLRTTSDNPDFTDVGTFCDLGGFADTISQTQGTLTKGSQTTLDGAPATTVVFTAPDQSTGTLYVATRGKPYPLKMEKTSGSETVNLTFKDFGVAVPTTTPSPSETVDLDQLNRENTSPTASPSSTSGASV